MGVWCSGITFDLHSKGLGFDPRYIQSNFLKKKYENTFNEKLNIYDNVIEKTIGNIKGDIIYNNLKIIGNEFNIDINKDFRKRLNKRIYS